MLEAGNSLLVKANAQFEGESVRITAHSIESLDGMAMAGASDLEVLVDSADALDALRQVLAGGGGGQGRVTLVSPLDTAREVAIELPGGYTVSPAVVRAIRAIPGVAAVQEV